MVPTEIGVPPENERRGVFLVPASANPYFEGRKIELEKLEVLLNNRKKTGLSSHCPVVAVHGLGGIGYGLRRSISIHEYY